MIMILNVAMLYVTLAAKMRSGKRTITLYSGLGCISSTETFTSIADANTDDLKVCTAVESSATTGSEHSIGGLTLIQQQKTDAKALHMQCSSESASLGFFTYTASSLVASCLNVDPTQTTQTFSETELNKLTSGSCATTNEGNSMTVSVTGQPSLSLSEACGVGATGDPHLTNLRGQKFDIHDGLHRLVHYPRDAPEEEALLKVDARAVDFGPDADCYSVFLQDVKLSGKWVGDDITLSTNTSVASSSASAFGISLALQQMDWPTLNNEHNGNLKLKGSVPVKVTTKTRDASADEMGGEEVSFEIGDQHPMFVQVWSSHGQNWVTHDKDVRFLNVHVKNLPKDAGGILGLDSYTKPSTSRCGLVQQERDLMNYIGKDLSLLSIKERKRFPWAASATVRQ